MRKSKPKPHLAREICSCPNIIAIHTTKLKNKNAVEQHSEKKRQKNFAHINQLLGQKSNSQY